MKYNIYQIDLVDNATLLCTFIDDYDKAKMFRNLMYTADEKVRQEEPNEMHEMYRYVIIPIV